MRLHGRREIMAYLGRSPRNKNGWRKVRARYGDVIRCYSGSGHVWALAEELDAFDLAHCRTMTEMLADRGISGEAVGEAVGGYPRECQRLVKRLFGPRTQRPD